MEHGKKTRRAVETWALAGVALAILLLGPSLASANVNGGIPAIAQFISLLRTSVMGFGGILFTSGLLKLAQNVKRAGGIEGLSEGGLGAAALGFMIGGAPFIAQQFGVAAQMLP